MAKYRVALSLLPERNKCIVSYRMYYYISYRIVVLFYLLYELSALDTPMRVILAVFTRKILENPSLRNCLK